MKTRVSLKYFVSYCSDLLVNLKQVICQPELKKQMNLFTINNLDLF